jgi:hypothetical protein
VGCAALTQPKSLAGLLDQGEQKRDQDGDDRNSHEQPDQSEGTLRSRGLRVVIEKRSMLENRRPAQHASVSTRVGEVHGSGDTSDPIFRELAGFPSGRKASRAARTNTTD